MTTSVQTDTINKLSIQHGLLIGGVSLVLSIVFRLIDPLLQFTNVWLGFLVLIIVVTLMVVLGIDVRKKNGGYLSFGQAFKSMIIMAVFITIISTIYSFVLFKFVDPELPSKVNAIVLEKTTASLTKMGIEQSKIDESTKGFQNGDFEAKMAPTLKNEAIGFAGGLALYAVIGLIIAASIKKNPPLFAPTDYQEPAI